MLLVSLPWYGHALGPRGDQHEYAEQIEQHRGRPAKNDARNNHSMEESLGDFYETAVGRGVFSAADWF